MSWFFCRDEFGFEDYEPIGDESNNRDKMLVFAKKLARLNEEIDWRIMESESCVDTSNADGGEVSCFCGYQLAVPSDVWGDANDLYERNLELLCDVEEKKSDNAE